MARKKETLRRKCRRLQAELAAVKADLEETEITLAHVTKMGQGVICLVQAQIRHADEARRASDALRQAAARWDDMEGL